MIVQLLLIPIFALIKGLLSLLPSMPSMPDWIGSLMDLVGKGLVFVPADIWILVIGNVSFWTIGLIGWGVIEWVYKKIPGVS